MHAISILRVVNEVLGDPTVKRATRIVSPKLTVVATRRFKHNRRNSREELVLTIGRPNYAARQLIKACVKAGEPFPVKKLQYQRA